MVLQFLDGMLARVQNDGNFSDPFPEKNGVKQGRVLQCSVNTVPHDFSAMLTDAFQDGENGINVPY